MGFCVCVYALAGTAENFNIAEFDIDQLARDDGGDGLATVFCDFANFDFFAAFDMADGGV